MTKEQKIRKEIKQIVDEIPKEDIENRVKQDEQEEAIETVLNKLKEKRQRETLILNGTDKKTADEMFEELGYIKKCEHKYKQPDNDGVTELILYRDEVKCLEIEFWNDKTISKSCGFDMSYITMQELQAINKKCEEMGWI